MNYLQEKIVKNLTEQEWHAILKDEFNWNEAFPISPWARSEFHHIHSYRCIDYTTLKKMFDFKMPSQPCWTKKMK